LFAFNIGIVLSRTAAVEIAAIIKEKFNAIKLTLF
jgi:hypothetical protein